MIDPISVQCECKEWSNVPYGTKEATCEHCQRGLKMVWGDLQDDESGEKCYPEEIVYYRPYGGATSFEEVDAYTDASEVAYNVSRTKNMFDAVYENIQSDDEMSPDEKISALETATKEMIRRIQHPQPSAKERIKNWLFGNFSKPVMAGDSEQGKKQSLFLVTKDVHGNWRWMTLFTNKFQDKDKEIFSESAHKEYEAWVDSTKNYPEARIWHVPGSGFGKADCLTYADGFMIASGNFYKGFEDVAARLAEMKDLGMSHGFTFSEGDLDSEGVYHSYRTFEVSVLPAEKAANPWTAFTLDLLKEEVIMGLSKEKRPFFVSAIGEERVCELEKMLPQFSKGLEEAGIGWKDLAEAMDPDPKPTGDPDPAGGGNGDPDPNPDPDPDPDEKVEAVGVRELTAAFKELLAPLAGAIAQLQSDIKELEKTDDEKIAARIGPRSDPTAAGGKRPTDSDGNVIDPDKVKNLDQSDANPNEGAAVTAARAIVDELMLGKRSSG